MLEHVFKVIGGKYFFFTIKSLSISLNAWDWWWSQSQFLRPKTKVSVSVSIFETYFIKCQSQSQNLIPILKVSVSVSKIETGYSESQSQHAKTGLAHPWEEGLRKWFLKISWNVLKGNFLKKFLTTTHSPTTWGVRGEVVDPKRVNS